MTSIVIAVVQALFLIRDPNVAFTDFMDPSVWFIFGSIVIGMTFSKTGLTKRMAYRMLTIIGEKTSMIYLGCFVMTSALTLIMAHTAVAAAVFPLLLTINSLYDDSGKPTRFGKGLFIGMAYVAGAGSIITLLGAARGAVAIGFYKEIVGTEITFFGLTEYMFPVGVADDGAAVGLHHAGLPPGAEDHPRPARASAASFTSSSVRCRRNEILTLVIVVTAILVLSLRSFVPALAPMHKSAVILCTTVLFFLLKILDGQGPRG